MYQLLIKYTKTILWLLKVAIVTTAIYVIYNKVFEVKNSISYQILSNVTSFQLVIIVIVLIVFSALNWGLEIFKWKVLVATIVEISFFEAAKQCLIAHTSSLVTPFKIGEFGAKTLFFDSTYRLKVLYLNLLGNVSQLMMTVIFGLLGVYFYQQILLTHFSTTVANSLFLLISILVVFIVLVGFMMVRYPFHYWKTIKTSIHLKNTGIAFLRYLLFSHQFALLLFVLYPTFHYTDVLFALFCMYLLAAIIPTLAIFDWSIKGVFAIFLLGLLGYPASEILLISLLLWIFNFAIPALIGSYFVVTFQAKNVVVNE